jgi:hypothetical protein
MVSKFLLDKYLLEAVFFGAMGCAAAMAFSGFGAAYTTRPGGSDRLTDR